MAGSTAMGPIQDTYDAMLVKSAAKRSWSRVLMTACYATTDAAPRSDQSLGREYHASRR